MALVKKAILDLQARGFQQASQAGAQISGSLDKAAASASAAGAAAARMGASFGAASGQANALRQGANQLGSIFARLGSASENPFLRAAGNVIGSGATGLAFGGVAGAGLGIVGTLIAEALGRLNKDDDEKGGKTEIHNHINVPLGDGTVQRAAQAAYDAIITGANRQIENLREEQATAARFAVDQGFGSLRR